MTQTLPHGSWPSPISADAATAASARIDSARFVGDEIWWAQSVPEQAGRVAIRRRTTTDVALEVLPAPWNARSRVHEYGGGAWTASDEGILYFVEKTDQRIRALRPGGEPVALTPEDTETSYGGLVWQAGRLLAVRERSRGAAVPARDIVEVPAGGGTPVVLASGTDFLAHPALSPDGGRLAWIGWNHPDMPWDATTLRVRDLNASEPTTGAVIAGGSSAPLQPTWTPQGELLFTDDATGRWNLRRWRGEGAPTTLASVDADTGGPLWNLGQRWFDATDGGVIAVRTNGSDELVAIDRTGRVRPLPLPLRAQVSIEDARGDLALVTGTTSAGTTGLWLVNTASGASDTVAGGTSTWAAEWMPQARPFTATGPHGLVHAFDFPPTSPTTSAAGPAPYVVFVHGGPTGHTGGAPSAKIAYFTSRGIGVLDVNYGGSSGYGRAYRERLRGQWGIVDVDDVAAAASALVEAAIADPGRIAIEGGSAGGWTVLSALVRTDVFAAGISRYGVADARTLAQDTHDFESRYLDGLIGTLPEDESVYIERSPLTHADRLRAPLLILQGDEDAVVPPSQAEALRAAVATRGIPHAYVLYPGEGHGFRRRETMIDALEKELAFLATVFSFSPDGLAPLALTGR